MPAGDLRYRVKFSEPNSVTDEYGNVTTGWLDRFTCRANITPRLGGEAIDAERLAGRQPAIIRVRRTTDTRAIRTSWKATNTADQTVYNINTVADPHMGDVEHGKWLEMLATA